jgi:protein SCO1
LHIALRAAAGLILISTMTAGCKQAGKGDASSTSQPAGELKTFPIRGKIVTVDTAKGSIVLEHEAVPGFMEAMTMSYKLKDPGIVSELHPGDRITAKLLVRKTSIGYEDAMLDEIVVTAQARPDYKPAVQYHVPTPGDVVPDFKLINQNGRPIHLSQFKGRAVLLTFIYTRCPLPDFCPRMNRNFAEIDKALKADSAMYAKTHLLTLSFDPKDDTPAVLKEYALAYAGQDAKFTHWEFAVPPAGELDAMTQFFDLGVTPGEGGTLNHSLSTVVIGKDGKVAAFYPTNEWTPQEVLAAMKTAAAA